MFTSFIERSSPSPGIGTPKRALAWAKFTAFARGKPSFRTANSLTRLIFRTVRGRYCTAPCATKTTDSCRSGCRPG
jgi:hypothetical protein